MGGRLEASWHDLHGAVHWAQVGDEEAASAAADAMRDEPSTVRVDGGSKKARVAELLALYGVCAGERRQGGFMNVTVLGGGNGGRSIAAHLTLLGHRV